MEENVLIVKMQPFFDVSKKYGACPVCAAVIIVNNEDVTAKCPNCHAELTVES